MSTSQWIVLAVVVVVVVAVLLWAVGRSRRRTRTLQNFGPEYDRTVAQRGDRRAAEHELVDRAKRRRELDIRPLSPEARTRYTEQWRVIQAHFVDQPEASIVEAHSLLDLVMRDRGYPVDTDDATELVSVDHPDVIEDYRAARAVRRKSESRLASTDELREALLRYRSLFDRLLHDGDSTDAHGTHPKEARR